MSDKEYQVRFNFPYAVVTVEADEGMINLWNTYIFNGRPFEVRYMNTVYTINPAMMTYMEVSEKKAF